MSLPRARTCVHGVAGQVERAGAAARFAARRAGHLGLGFAKVVLWLSVVTSSLVAIAMLAARGARYQRSDLDRTLREQAQRAQARELHRRAIPIDQAQLDALLRAAPEMPAPRVVRAPSPPP